MEESLMHSTDGHSRHRSMIRSGGSQSDAQRDRVERRDAAWRVVGEREELVGRLLQRNSTSVTQRAQRLVACGRLRSIATTASITNGAE
jgi:hypothetical protein